MRNHCGPVMDRINGYDVIDCGPCGFRHISPFPDNDALTSIYRDEYYSKEKPLYLERHLEDLEWWDTVYAARYREFERLLPGKGRSVLDIGSGPGYFLLYGKRHGWETLGVEPSVKAAAHGRSLGLEIIEDFFSHDLARALDRSFDVVHMSEVLEHITDPEGVLITASRALKPGGLVCVVVPNDYNPFQQALRKACGYSPWWVSPPHHVNYFNPVSVSGLLTRTGFETVSIEATFPIDIFLLMGDEYVGNDALGRACHAKRKRFEKNLAAAGQDGLLRNIYKDLARHGVGREVQAIGRKKE
ncbi:MAG: methyltransferase type 12 [Deltaproteobacteria bacterium GWA2_55_10]|nr:MAG: methyltransferase type 12 [Deltaproteobacteria bacterium GWA2_55_10]